MVKRSVVSVDCEIPGGLSDFLDFDSRASLLDWDIILFNPSMVNFRFSSHSYKGKPSLGDERSFRLKEYAEHWRRELADAYRSGKVVFVFLPQYFEVYVDTGERQYSGTGRNRQTTRLVAPQNNYQCLPVNLDAIASEGRAMKLAKDGALLADYWKEFAEFSAYKALISGDIGTPCILTKSGEKTVGSILQNPDTGGALVFLPYLDLWSNEFYEEREISNEDDEETETELVWTAGGKAFGNKLLNCLIEIERSLRSSSEISPAPEWLDNPGFELPKANQIRGKLLRIESKIEELEKEKEQIKSDLFQHEKPRRLLYEKGKPLEIAIITALELLGFEAFPYEDAESEFDAVFSSKEGRFLGEAEGKDNKAINIEKLRQLEMNILEDFDRDEVDEVAKAVLFGNAFRIHEPGGRGEFFTAKCVSAAKRSGTALVRTIDLFPLVQYLSGKKDRAFATKCRKAIFATKGEIVVFPDVPTREDGDSTSSED